MNLQVTPITIVNIWKEKKGEQPITTNIGFHGGEPLVNIEFIMRMVDYTKTIDKDVRKFTFSLVTNGILLDRYLDFIVHNNISLL